MQFNKVCINLEDVIFTNTTHTHTNTTHTQSFAKNIKINPLKFIFLKTKSNFF